MNDAAVLAGLDFTPEPRRCECDDCQHHPRQPCRNIAAFSARVHMFGACRHQDVRDTGGYVTQFVCEPCVLARASRVAKLFDSSRRACLMLGNFILCGGCGRPLDDAHKFWEVVSL